MKKVKLGNTGYEITPIIYAGIVSMDEKQSDSDFYVSRAIDAGLNYFDVAPSYNNAEIIMGNSLKPYRKDVYLACKTTERLAVNAEKNFYQSLKNLHTDYFDVYQLHSLSSPQDVGQAFGPGGTMDMILKFQKQGLVRKIGFSAHSERAALEALKLYDFDSVMFPLNWMLNMGQGIGDELTALKKEKGFGVLGIKTIVERAWFSEEERHASIWPKSWCKPFDKEDKDLRVAAMRYALKMGADVLIPPGNWESQSFMQAHIQEALDSAYSQQDEALLKAHFEKVKDQPFFYTSEGDWPAA